MIEFFVVVALLILARVARRARRETPTTFRVDVYHHIAPSPGEREHEPIAHTATVIPFRPRG